MGWFYSVFGLGVWANQAIPGLEAVAAFSETPHVEVHLGAEPDAASGDSGSRGKLVFASSILLESGEPALKIWEVADGSLRRMDYFDGTKFWLDRAGNTVWATWPPTSSLEDTATYLLGPVLGFVLRSRGVTCLHASAVALAGAAVVFVGAEGTGKSTTAAAMASRRHAVISDDIVALTERDGIFLVSPAFPYLCLWPDSVNILYGPDKVLPSFSANYDKRQLLLAENHLRFQEKPMPLGAIYLLGERCAEEIAPYAEKLTPRESLLALVADSYATNLMDTSMRAKEFELVGRLVRNVPIYRLRPHQDGSRIGRLCELIERGAGDTLDLHRSIASRVA